MSATKNYLHDYNQAFDDLLIALDESIARFNALNDLVYCEDGEIRCRVPRADVSLIAGKVKALSLEMNCYDSAKEPYSQSPILPGEVRYVACS